MTDPLPEKGDGEAQPGSKAPGPEQIERFAAEWDQPFEMKTANPAAAAPYAVSQPLETQRDGDRLTFHLTGLRHGKLRIIYNVGPHPHSVSHVYGRREPQGSDVVVEVDLKESRFDLVITPNKSKAGSRRWRGRVVPG